MTGTALAEIAVSNPPRWSLYGAIAELRRFDLTDISTPIEEVKRYLLAKYDARFDCHPRMFEETVASVFGSLGYAAQATAYSKDGGIDVILRHSNGTTTGVQVKRSRNPIEVEQIRSFAGALLVGGCTSGMFVTTSRFTAGARKTRDSFALRGYPIELVDAPKFFDTLRITTRPQHSGYDDWLAAHGEPNLHTIYDDYDASLELDHES